ncbi:hypothetical protein [uncultured Sphingomonas sp.]|uniref:hypothetical protein n=1 Tax=uncultured Sphingomonas sp. TaxID=158754 RepID=UPI0035CBDE7D
MGKVDDLTARAKTIRSNAFPTLPPAGTPLAERIVPASSPDDGKHIMTSIITRACCAMLSIIGAVGLVAFADPGSTIGTVRSDPAKVIAAAGPVAVAQRG